MEEKVVCETVTCNTSKQTKMAAFYNNIRNFLITTERSLLWHLGHRPPPDAFAVALTCGTLKVTQNHNFSLKDILNDAFLWAVPKHRRSIFRRRQRRFGIQERFWKMTRTKTNLIVCNDCGNHKEAGLLCPICYDRVKIETEAIQDQIQKELGLSPVDKEVVVLYDGEQVDQKNEFWKGKRIVEMKRARPPWFSNNLLQPTTQAPATTAAVEPKDLA